MYWTKEEHLPKGLYLGGGAFLLTAWVAVLCFYHLGEAGTQNWDEARHIANAYEMLDSDNLWVSTYRGETDYFNYKPPLSMWCILLCFKLFGVSYASMRLYSAVSMMGIFALLFVFTARKFGKRASLIFGMLFASGTDLFFFHMARSADADALYLLMFTAAMICLFLTEKKPWMLTGCGIFLSLAFMAKCLHAAAGAAVVFFYLPRIWKNLKWKHLACAAASAAIPVGAWAIARYCYDGAAFFSGMLMQEVVGKVEHEKDYFAYLRYFLGKPVVVGGLAAAVAAAVLIFLNRKKELAGTGKEWLNKIIGNELYLFFLWLLIPLGIYSLSGAFMEWYGYICYLPFCVIVAVILTKASRLKGKYGCMLAIVPVLCLMVSGKQSFVKLKTLNYMNNTDIRRDMAALAEQYPERRGAPVYIENDRNEYNLQNEWEQNNVADAYIAGDFIPKEGGVPLFMEDPDGILVIAKNLFEGYSSVLTGRVILVDGDYYLIFSNEFYE